MSTEQEIRLFDSQWVNVVNHDNCYDGYTVEDAVNMAVKLTEVLMAKNYRNNTWPTANSEALNSHRLFAERLEKMQKNGDNWITVHAVLALLNNCDSLAGIEGPNAELTGAARPVE